MFSIKNENAMSFKGKVLEFNEEQRRIFIDAQQLWEAFCELYHEGLSYRGGLYWKNVRGRDYLIRVLDSRGATKSLGPRSPETEKIFENWHRKKEEFRRKREAFMQKADIVRRMCKALHLNRVPLVVAKIAREMFLMRDLRKRTMILGTNAIYAYEAMAGVFVSSGLLATRDLDVLWDARSCLQIAGLSKEGFLGLLKRADPSFRPGDTPYRAVNKDGFWVELLKPTPKTLTEIQNPHLRISPFPEDMLALETKGTRWIVSCPKVYAIAIGHDGLPVPLVVPDPRAFVLHKLWVARQTDRPALKRKRDVAQALLVFYLLKHYLPQFPLNEETVNRELQALPVKLRKLTKLLSEDKNEDETYRAIRNALPSMGY
ncbi:GSU2403 family nucleotidyltransferase fold protein [Thermosulfurimonas sp. F29]|uniref:GSU2403 family nucleotidyltransferase fold protein n=1 Tax=Thermosulfurimonas sp. F29 TaxID=2867247 RepID=UPI001C836B36|nr:GSU2403 family nucleotidyltransferase fold protein [Thermosulfurimonas sp. F29]MBX6423434.1 nucleotidyltransferase domain-containing protein [Thermosulfurimonas sp. F29]